MKRYFLLLSLFICTLASTAQNQFTLSGIVKDAKEPFVYLFYNNVTDSFRLQNDRFTFKGDIAEPTIAVIRTNRKIIPDTDNRNIARIFMEPTDMTAEIVYDRFYEMTITGSKTNDEFEALNKKRKHINDTFKDSLVERHSKLTEDYVFNNRDSYISALELSFRRGGWSKNSVQYLYSRFTPKIQNSLYGREIKATLDGLDANSEGRKAKDFIANDLPGKRLELSNFKGKYVLLDFWGSWCVPCRESSPHLIELFKKYSGKGFTVIGIATEYDETDTKWRQAIQKDGTGIWHNVLSKPLAGSPVQLTKDIAGMFNVHIFPTKILVDPCGFIIGRFKGTGDDVKLDEQLKEIFK